MLDVGVAPTDILGVKSLFAGKPPFQSEHLGHFVRASTGINGSAFFPNPSSAQHGANFAQMRDHSTVTRCRIAQLQYILITRLSF